MRSDLVKRFATGSSTSSLADGATVDIPVTIPIDVTSGLGIQIWAWQAEIGPGGTGMPLMSSDAWELEVILSRDTVSASVGINNASVIDKIHEFVDAPTPSQFMKNVVFGKELYPAVPYFSNTIHFGIVNNTGGTITSIYVRLWYSVIMVSQAEMLGLLANAGVP